MVGGFSECEIVQDAIRKAFPECRVVVPHEAGLAVLIGAVLFGHKHYIRRRQHASLRKRWQQASCRSRQHQIK